ncbi:TonB-dependent receptor [Sphingomonas sanxanigenens]|nr:TonB-dependent receptor [Sphingomonas sanxanigenens]
MKPFVSAFAMGGALAAILASPAYAAGPAVSEEEVALAPAPNADSEIVVTARRRDEDAQDVPIALSVVGAQQLEATGNFSLGQIQQLVPSLQVFSFNPRNTNVNIRGLGSNVALTNDGLENGVGIYIDNVYYGRVGQSQFDLVDLQQIEVLRGPQGTLFGKNTTAGAINITTRAPSFEPEFSGEASLGDYGYHQLRGSLSAPLIGDSVAFRLSIADTHRDGFLTNLHDDSAAQDYDNFTARGQLLVKPSADVAIKLIADFSRQRQHHVLNVLADYFGTYDNGAAIPNNFVDRVTRAGYTPLPIRPFDRRGDSDGHYQANMKSYGFSGQLDWDLGGAALTSVSAYRWWDWAPANDGDSTGLPVITKAQQANRQRQFSQEVRLASTGGRTIDYVVGAYYFWQIVRGFGATAYGSAAANWNLPAVPAVVGDAALNGFEAQSTSTPETRSYALFGQGTWNLSEALKLTAGLRYTHEKKQGEYHQWHAAGPDLTGLPAAVATAAAAIRNQFNPVTDYGTSFTDDSLSWLANLSYAVAPDALVYATWSRGNKSGGLNLTALPAGVDPEVRPEKVDAYEVGLKSQFLNRQVTFNLAGFWSEISDYQTAITEQVANTVNFRQYIANIPKVRSRGLEADLIYAPTRLLSVSASAAYTDATYRDYRNAPEAPENLNRGGIQDLSGARLPGVPKFTYSLGADAAQPIGHAAGSDLELYGHADFSHRSTFNTSSSNSRYADVPGYGVLNTRIGIRADGARWDLSVWARNLTDEDYFQTLSPGNTGLVTALIGEPRTWGATFRTKL